jgi:hydrogenase maturation protease
MNSGDPPSVLVMGIGNPDRGDDGVGPAVVGRLRNRVPTGVSVLERGGDALALLDNWEGFSTVILVDAVAPISEPGRVHRLDLAQNPLPLNFAPCSTHAFGLAETVELARSLRKLPSSLGAYLVEGEQFETGAQLSPAIGKAVDEVAERILAEIAALLEARRDHA